MKESYLRYKYTQDYKYRGFDYIDYNDNSFSLITVEDEKDKPVTIYKTPQYQTKFIDTVDELNIYLLRGHKLSFYKNYNRTSDRQELKPLKVSKNSISVKVTEDIVIHIKLENGETAVEYPDCIVIYDKNKSKIKDIRIIKNGLVLTALCGELDSEIYVFDDKGNTKYHTVLSDLSHPDLLNQNYFEPLTILPRLISYNNKDIILTYDHYGMITSDSTNNTHYSVTQEDNCTVYTSDHPIFFDNFDYENYYFEEDNRRIEERISINNENKDIEYARTIYNDLVGRRI